MLILGYILLYALYTSGLFKISAILLQQMFSPRSTPDFIVVAVIPFILILMWRDLGGSAPRRLHVLFSTAVLVIELLIHFKSLPILIPLSHLAWIIVLTSIWTIFWAGDSIWEKVHAQRKAERRWLSNGKKI